MRKLKIFMTLWMIFLAAKISYAAPYLQQKTTDSKTKKVIKDPRPVTPTGLGFSLGVWMNPNFSGITQTGGGTLISLNHNLGFTNQTLFIPKIWYRWRHGQILDLSYAEIQQTVAQKLNAPETFQGLSFPEGEPETSNMDIKWADLTYEYPIYYDTYPPVNRYLNVVLDMKYLQGAFNMTNSLGETSAHPPIYVVFPLIGLHGKFKIAKRTTAEFKTEGIMAGFEDAVGYSYDLQAGLTYRFAKQVGLSAKYRNFDFYNRDASDNIFSFRLYGPEINLVVDF